MPCIFLTYNVSWQMLLLSLGRCYCLVLCGRCYNYQADVAAYSFTNWQILLPLFWSVADVIAIVDFVADVLPSNIYVAIVVWQMLLPRWQTEWPTMVGVEVLADVIATSGRWNSHWVNFLFQLEFWTVAQNLIPYMRQMVLPYVLVEGWIVDPYV